jgi:Molybdate transporter of MFS superfamily
MLSVAVGVGMMMGEVLPPRDMAPVLGGLSFALPSLGEAWRAFEMLVLPQLPLTLTNAVILTALVCRDLYPAVSARASERNLALSTGLANLLLAPFGAMPMCHGAGGVQAQHRFGARTGLAPILLGIVLLVLGVGFASSAAALFGVIPIGAVGALLLIAGSDLAVSRRLFDAQPSCWPVIGVAAAATLLVNPAIGLIAGCLGEIVRKAILRAINKPSATT